MVSVGVLLVSIVVLICDAVALGIWTIFVGFDGTVPSVIPGVAIIVLATGIAGAIGTALFD